MEKWIIYAIISMIFAGITSVLAKFGMKNLNSDTALAIRTSIVFSIIIANAFLFRNAYTEIQGTSLKNIFFLTLSGITTSLSWILHRSIKQALLLH